MPQPKENGPNVDVGAKQRSDTCRNSSDIWQEESHDVAKDLSPYRRTGELASGNTRPEFAAEYESLDTAEDIDCSSRYTEDQSCATTANKIVDDMGMQEEGEAKEIKDETTRNQGGRCNF